MDTNKDIDRIEKYLNNELNDAERASLDNHIAENEDLADEFKRRESAHLALDYLVAKNLKAQLEELEAESKVVPLHKKRKSRMVILSIAASMLLLVGAFYFILPQNNMSSPELAAAYYEQPDFSNRSAGNAISEEEKLNEGMEALQNGQYEAAISSLETIAEGNAYYIVAQYYLGHSFYATGQYAQAAQNFAIVSASNDLRYLEDAQWYELLSCLAQDNSCSSLLDKLVNNNSHSHHQQALEINKKTK